MTENQVGNDYKVCDQIIKRYRGKETYYRDKYNYISIDKAIEINQKYRELRNHHNLSKASDVDLAIYGMSFYLWQFS
jgi:hypothetical protein